MKNCKSGATYIYERVNGTIYAREHGKNERHVYSESATVQSTRETLLEDKLWGEIRRAAKTDPILQAALERVIIVYQLSKEKYGTK